MIEDLKSAIRANMTTLFDAAELLASRMYFGPAIHLMIAAREECVKWVLAHCWVHLDRDSRAKIFRHRFKHKAAGIFYFLSGQLQAISFVIAGVELLKEKEPQISEASAALIELLSKRIEDPKSVAKSIPSSLYAGLPNESKEITAKRDAAVKKLVDDAEELRHNSIYVDFDEALQICGQPNSFTQSDYEKVKKDVILAMFHIDKLSGLQPNADVLHSTFPEWKDEYEKSIRDLASRIDDEKQDQWRTSDDSSDEEQS